MCCRASGTPEGEGYDIITLMKRYYMEKALDKAKQLRQNQTDTEAILWSRLRNRSLNGIKFRRQVPIDKYIVDFVASDKKLIIELDGSQHLEEKNTIKDEERTIKLQVLGYKVIRIFNNDIYNNLDTVLEYIYNEYLNI